MKGSINNIEGLQLKITSRLVEIYGQSDGLKNSSVLVPAILNDFSSMLQKSKIGQSVSETYRTEDGVAEIILTATKTTGGSNVIAEIRRLVY